MVTTIEGAMSGDLDVTVHFEDGTFWATVAEFPGVFATGETLEELRESLTEGIALVLTKPGEPVLHVEVARFRTQPVVASASASFICG